MQTEIVEKVLRDYFSEYKYYHTWAILLFGIVMLLTQILQAIYISRRIEKFKNELKKSEIKFSRFNQLQIEALKKIYDGYVTFHFKNYRLFYPSTYGHDSLKYKIKDWRNEFDVITELLHREKILLTPELLKEIKSFETNFKKISELLYQELQDLLEIEEFNESSDVQILYNNPENEVSGIKHRIERLQAISEVKKSEEMIKELRSHIEKYFQNLVE